MKYLIIISAPSGTGKTTLCKALRKVIPEINWSVSYTTREIRLTEIDGKDYHFISNKKFKSFIKSNYFAEWENVHGKLYGTRRDFLEDAIFNENYLLLEMDVKGAMTIKKLYSQNTFSIFIVPPSINHLRERLINRGTESLEKIDVRLKRFKEEMGYSNKFDHIMVNENLDLAKIELIKIINTIKKGVSNGT